MARAQDDWRRGFPRLVRAIARGFTMSISTIAAAPAPAPQHVADLRPVADAVASRRDTEPALPVVPPPAASLTPIAFPPVAPPSPATKAEVGRTLLAAEGSADDRKLKPFGIDMLPRSVAGDQAAQEQRAAREKVKEATTSRDRLTGVAPEAAPQAATSLRLADAPRPAVGLTAAASDLQPGAETETSLLSGMLTPTGETEESDSTPPDQDLPGPDHDADDR